MKRKLAPRYVGPYKIIERSGRVAYKLQLPLEMRAIFNVFHIYQLRKCLRIPKERVETEDIKIESDLTYEDVYTKIWKEERGNSKLPRLCHQGID